MVTVIVVIPIIFFVRAARTPDDLSAQTSERGTSEHFASTIDGELTVAVSAACSESSNTSSGKGTLGKVALVVVVGTVASLTSNDCFLVVVVFLITGVATSPAVIVVLAIVPVAADSLGLTAVIVLILSGVTADHWLFALSQDDDIGFLAGKNNRSWRRSLLDNDLLGLRSLLSNDDGLGDGRGADGGVIFGLLTILFDLRAAMIVSVLLDTLLNLNIAILTTLYALIHDDFGVAMVMMVVVVVIPRAVRATVPIAITLNFDDAAVVVEAALPLVVLLVDDAARVGSVGIDLALALNNLAFDNLAPGIKGRAGALGVGKFAGSTQRRGIVGIS